jgi:hypothetical protein
MSRSSFVLAHRLLDRPAALHVVLAGRGVGALALLPVQGVLVVPGLDLGLTVVSLRALVGVVVLLLTLGLLLVLGLVAGLVLRGALGVGARLLPALGLVGPALGFRRLVGRGAGWVPGDWWPIGNWCFVLSAVLPSAGSLAWPRGFSCWVSPGMVAMVCFLIVGTEWGIQSHEGNAGMALDVQLGDSGPVRTALPVTPRLAFAGQCRQAAD